MILKIYLFSGLFFLLFGCKTDSQIHDTKPVTEFGQPVKVQINGYNGNIMEPFLTRDGKLLLFNNLNSSPENTNLHWATKTNDTTFQYQGELSGINTLDLEAVPTMDYAGNLYFVSTRNYANTLSTLYQCHFLNGNATNVALIKGVSKLQAGWVNFDVEISADGQSLYFVDAQFNQTGNPQSADIVIAQKNGSSFQRLANSSELLKNINTNALEYAACISANQLELYFTRVQFPITIISSPEIFVATRQNINDAFGIPTKIQSITGFAEAATISPDQKTLYFHKKENNKLLLYKVSW